jgi:hypothetical protein
MFIHSLLKRGSLHKENCEDFLFQHQISQEFYICGVFDGCSSGKDSHFASALMAKTLKSVAASIKPDPSASLDDLLKVALFQTIKKIHQIRQSLKLQTDELLATIILLITNQFQKTKIICIGDGFLSLNNQNIEIDENNQPNYLAYDLDNLISPEYFLKWYEKLPHVYEIDQITDVSISTDGILSFSVDGFAKTSAFDESVDPCNYLMKDQFLLQNPSMLARKINILKNKYHLTHLDDLGIIRLIK